MIIDAPVAVPKLISRDIIDAPVAVPKLISRDIIPPLRWSVN
jgi:hypothetical protein